MIIIILDKLYYLSSYTYSSPLLYSSNSRFITKPALDTLSRFFLSKKGSVFTRTMKSTLSKYGKFIYQYSKNFIFFSRYLFSSLYDSFYIHPLNIHNAHHSYILGIKNPLLFFLPYNPLLSYKGR